MQNTHTPKNTFSTNQIVFFLVFVCASIMTSLFVFHLRQKPVQPPLSPDVGMVFSVPREIKSFDLLTGMNQKFSLQNFNQHWTLVFFGFTHCANVCPTTLGMMSKAYPSLHEKYPNLQVVLVSLDPERDDLTSLQKYTQFYHADFVGVTGKIQELRKFQSQLGVYSERVPGNQASAYQIQHTSSIMLIDPQGRWAGLFKFGLKPDQFAQGVQTAIETLSQKA